MTKTELGHIKRVQVMKAIHEAGKILTREVIFEKYPKKVRIKSDYDGPENMSSWWYNKLKGHTFEVELIFNDHTHYKVINNHEEMTGSYIFRKHAKVIA